MDGIFFSVIAVFLQKTVSDPSLPECHSIIR